MAKCVAYTVKKLGIMYILFVMHNSANDIKVLEVCENYRNVQIAVTSAALLNKPVFSPTFQ